MGIANQSNLVYSNLFGLASEWVVVSSATINEDSIALDAGGSVYTQSEIDISNKNLIMGIVTNKDGSVGVSNKVEIRLEINNKYVYGFGFGRSEVALTDGYTGSAYLYITNKSDESVNVTSIDIGIYVGVDEDEIISMVPDIVVDNLTEGSDMMTALEEVIPDVVANSLGGGEETDLRTIVENIIQEYLDDHPVSSDVILKRQYKNIEGYMFLV